MWVERLHPRDGDGKFAHGGAGGGLHVVSTSRGGPVLAERGTVRAGATAPAGGKAAGPWSGSGLRHVGRLAGKQYHLKRAGGVWSVFDGTPEQGRKIGTAGTIAEAKAHAEAHAAGRIIPAATPPPPRVPAPSRGETVTSSARAARVSPTTAAAITAARAAVPASTDDWHQAALLQVDPAKLAELKRAAEKATKAHERSLAKLNKIRDDYIERTVAAMKRERDAGLHTRYDAAGNQVPIPDTEIEERAARSALNQPAFLAQQKKSVPTLVAMAHAEGDYEDALKNQALPRTPDGLAMPSDALNGHLDRVVGVGRLVLIDAEVEFERTATAKVRAAQEALDYFDAWAGKLAETDRAYGSLRDDGATATTVVTPDGVEHRLTDPKQARELEMAIRGNLFERKDTTKAARNTVARHQQQVLLDLLASARPMGGIHHSNATVERDTSGSSAFTKPTAARADWRQRLAAAEDMFPRSWLAVHAGRPLSVGASERAYYQPATNHLSFTAGDSTGTRYEGAFPDQVAEVAVHELGHRMEQYIPGLTALEFAMVRRRATRPDGTVEPITQLPGYGKDEKGQPDEWARPYAGKSYEGPFSGNGRGPHETAWEVFQVGLQDTFGRSRERYGRKSDPQELQAFVLGAMLTLG